MAKRKLTLLEKAKQVKLGRRSPRPITEEEMDLVLAWLADEITLTQASRALGGTTSGACMSRIAITVREAVRTGRLIDSRKL